MHHPPPRRRRVTAALALLTLAVSTLALAPAAHAADQGTGFGTWAPLSRTGWHGSMRVGDMHTYCIHPGLPVATGTTTDRGTTTEVNGLTPQQLMSINHLVTTYGQTDDPVQAAGVGWAVKAIADRDTTLHSWGYTGDDLPGAIDHIMRRASPENSAAVQARAVRYLAEAESVAAPRIGGSLALSTDADDPTRGTVTADVDPAATGVLHLENAVFADTGGADRTDVRAGVVYPILAPATSSEDGRPYVVRATGSFSVRSAAIRYFSTPGQQESAGPAEPTRFDLATEDAAARPVRFSPRIATAAHIDDGRFVDDVTFSSADGVWPRHADGTFVSVSATAEVFRTSAWPAESAEIPSNVRPVLSISLRTDPGRGAGTYTALTEKLPGPGVYTAVWRIERTAQDADTTPHLPLGFVWTERFASPTQTEQFAPPTPSDPPSPTPVAATPPPAPVAVAAPAPAALAATGVSTTPLGLATSVAAALAAVGLVAGGIARRRKAAGA